MFLCAVLVVEALVFRLTLVHLVSSSFATVAAPYALLPSRLDPLALGALLALKQRGGHDLGRYRPHAHVVIAASSAALAILFVTRGGLSAIDEQVQTLGWTA